MVVLGIFSIALAIIGLMQAKCGGCKTTCCYVMCAGLFALILGFVGVIFVKFSDYNEF